MARSATTNTRSETHETARGTRIAVALVGAMLMSLGCAGGSANGSGSGSGSGGTGAPGSSGAGTGAGSGGRSAGTGGSSTGPTGSGGTAGAAAPLGLPVVVTNFYTNQGWFGDANVMAYFTPGSTIIRQASSTTGPCGARQPGAVGQCLQVTYSPPTGLAPPSPGAGFVGVFFLTSLTMAHPETTPPMRAGDPNWGDEPGKNIAPGATSISYSAASATAGLVVTFKAGTANDSLVLPELPQTLTTGWTRYSMPIAGLSYGTSVAGAFAWVLKDTTQPATFYLDGIVWE